MFLTFGMSIANLLVSPVNVSSFWAIEGLLEQLRLIGNESNLHVRRGHLDGLQDSSVANKYIR